MWWICKGCAELRWVQVSFFKSAIPGFHSLYFYVRNHNLKKPDMTGGGGVCWSAHVKNASKGTSGQDLLTRIVPVERAGVDFVLFHISWSLVSDLSVCICPIHLKSHCVDVPRWGRYAFASLQV